MRRFTAFPVAAIAALLFLPATAQESGQAPAQVTCENGKVVSITVLLPEAGIFTLHVPPGVCEKTKAKPAPRPQAPASSSRSI